MKFASQGARRARKLPRISIASLSLASAAIVAVALFAPSVAADGATSSQTSSTSSTQLVVNGGFTKNTSGWKTNSPKKDTLSVTASGHSGRAAKLSSKADVVVLNDKKATVTGAARGTTYTMKAWVRTSRVDTPAMIRVREVAGDTVKSHTSRLKLQDKKWHHLTLTFKTTLKKSKLDLNVLFWNVTKTQHVFVDTVSLTTVTPAAASSSSTSKTSTSSTSTGKTSTGKTSTSTTSTSKTSTSNKDDNATAGAAKKDDNARAGAVKKDDSATSPASSKSDAADSSKSDSSASTNSSTCKQATLSGTKFGVNLDLSNGRSMSDAWEHAVSSFGTPDVVRVFNSGAPSNWNAATVAKGADISVSFKILPKDVLSGKYDSKLRSWFRAAPSNVAVYWTYYHEPEDQIENGTFTAADYRAAWKHIVDIQRETCQPNLHSMLILMDWTVASGSGRTFSDYYPGSKYIDVLGWDPYNPWQHNTEYKDPSAIFGKLISVSKAQGKPFAIAETGSLLEGNDKGAGRAAWLKKTASYLQDNGALFVTYFDTLTPLGNDFRLTDAASKNAWKAVVTD